MSLLFGSGDLFEDTWRNARNVFEDSGEVALIGKTSGKRNGGQIDVGPR